MPGWQLVRPYAAIKGKQRKCTLLRSQNAALCFHAASSELRVRRFGTSTWVFNLSLVPLNGILCVCLYVIVVSWGLSFGQSADAESWIILESSWSDWHRNSVLASEKLGGNEWRKLCFSVNPQGSTGPRGDPGRAGPPGPPVSALIDLHHTPLYWNLYTLKLSFVNTQGPPATMIEPLPIRDGRKKKRRHSDRAAAGGAAPSGREDDRVPDMEDFLQGDQPLEDPEGMEEVFASLSSMKNEVELIRRPLGTYESPARTCKELMMVQPNYKDGKCTPALPSRYREVASNI